MRTDVHLDLCSTPAEHAQGASDSSEAESEGKFKQLQELFARKTEQRKKGKATQDKPSKKQAELGPSGEPYTALELQVLQLKAKHEGILLMIEVGYKYKFFGDDAKVC
jgi:DNA mismatch repair protein MSH3